MAKKRRKQTETAAALFGIYGILMLYLLFIRGRHAVDGIPYWEQVLNNYNLVPFYTVGSYWHVLTNKEYYLEKWQRPARLYQSGRKCGHVRAAGLPAACGQRKKANLFPHVFHSARPDRRGGSAAAVYAPWQLRY